MSLDVHATLDPAPTVGDPRLLERLIMNLIGNAIHHNTRRRQRPSRLTLRRAGQPSMERKRVRGALAQARQSAPVSSSVKLPVIRSSLPAIETSPVI